MVLRVQTIPALWPRTDATIEAVAVATPLRWHRKFSAVRSAVSTPRVGPRMVAMTSPGCTALPSGHPGRTSIPGSINSNASFARSRPEITPACRATSAVVTRWPGGTMASVVMSPARPRSSSKAARTIGSSITRGNGSSISSLLQDWGFHGRSITGGPQRIVKA